MEEAEASGIIPGYNRDLAAAFDADHPVRKFAEDVSLNDAYVDRVLWDEADRTISLLLLTGSLQVGYWRTTLTYEGVSAIEGMDALRSALTRRPTEIWYDEFFRDGDHIVHGVLLAPYGVSIRSPGEFAIRFEHFSCEQTAASDRVLHTAHDESRWSGR